MNSRFLFNIKGCIEKYQDFETPRSWLAQGRKELDPASFEALLDSLLRWFVETKVLRVHAVRLAALLEEVSQGFGAKMKEELLKAQQAEAVEQKALEEEEKRRAKLEAEREKYEKERLAALEKVRKEKERQQRQLKEDQRKMAKQKQRLLEELHSCFQNDFMTCEAFYHEKCASNIAFDDFSAARRDFVRQWFRENMPTVDGKAQHLPDEEQLEAIAALDKQIQVIARAGSGKTSTTVNRALFLVKHCNFTADRILLLAFNRKAALEIRKRLLMGLLKNSDTVYSQAKIAAKAHKSAYKKDSIHFEENLINRIALECDILLPHVMTFHALAHAIVHPEEELLYDGEDGEPQKLSRAIQDVIDTYLRSPEKQDQVRDLMLEHFKSDWELIVSGGYEKSREELLAFRRSLPHETLGGEYVKSYGEKLIANFLFEHGIPYKYEKNHRWNGTNYRPDFTLYCNGGRNLIIEYFGLQGDLNYDRMSQEKRNYWSGQSGYIFMEFSPVDITRRGEEGFHALLTRSLEQCGISCVRLSEDAIWEKVKDRSIDRLTRATVNFVGRCRQQCLAPEALQKRIQGYRPIDRAEARFLHLASNIFSDYMVRLQATGEEDFNGLLQRAAAAVTAGRTRFARKNGSGDIKSLSHVFIDEYQDFSKLFFNLIQAILSQNSAVRLFCVGDDWQAINGFAGSEMHYFNEFQKHLGERRLLHIATNYRSFRSIVELGNALMHGEGEPARAKKQASGQVLLCDVDGFAPSFLEEQLYPGDLLTPAVLRLISKSLQQEGRIVLLSRKNSIPWYIAYPERKSLQGKGLEQYLFYLRSLLPKDLQPRISISTAHKYKGLERATAILLDVISSSYPLIHPDSIFTRILGDSPNKQIKEERRLLYVAMTRAIHTLYILTDRQKPSPFLQELETRFLVPNIYWRQYPPMSMQQRLLLVAVGNQPGTGGAPTFAIKDVLKAAGYTWRGEENCWIRSAPANGFSMRAIASEIWARSGDGLEVRIMDGQETCLACYHVNRGSWTRVDVTQ